MFPIQVLHRLHVRALLLKIMSMETDSPVVYHGTSESRFPKNEIQKIATELTAEEKDILRQCNKESLYYRCIPFMMGGIAATQLAARKGYITPHPVWGTSVSMAGAAFVGWILGKFAYRSKCEEKFLRLENSNIGDAIRRKRGYVLERYQSDFSKPKSYDDDMRLTDNPSFSHYPDSDFHSSTGSLNLDVDKNIQYSGLDDLGRPSTDRDSTQLSEESEPVRRFTTYEELRQSNREDYEKSQRPLSSRLDAGSLTGPGNRPWSTVDTTPPRRYYSDLNEGNKRTEDSWDNAKLL